VRRYGPPVSTDDRTTRNPSGAPASAPTTTPYYERRVRGHLAPRWAAWLHGLHLSAADDGTTMLRGPVMDQAALHGLLQRLRDLGLPMLSLTQLVPDAPTTDGPAPEHEGS